MSSVSGSYLGHAAIPVFALVMTAAALAAGPETGRNEAGSPQPSIRFDIPAQSLSDALYAYSAVTGIEILVPGDLLTRRQSTGITGALASEDALRTLLQGTGLVPRYTGSSAFTLMPVTPDAAFPAGRIPRYPGYSAALQAAVTSALCRLRETQPGGYRVAARFWVAPSGAVSRVSLLGTTGEAERDALLAGLLGRIVVDEPPPAHLPQPTTVVVLPQRENSPECGADAGATP